MNYCKSNIILSNIGYLRRKSLEDQAWKTPPPKDPPPHLAMTHSNQNRLQFLLRFSTKVLDCTSNLLVSTISVDVIHIHWAKHRLDLIALPLLAPDDEDGYTDAGHRLPLITFFLYNSITVVPNAPPVCLAQQTPVSKLVPFLKLITWSSCL